MTAATPFIAQARRPIRTTRWRLWGLCAALFLSACASPVVVTQVASNHRHPVYALKGDNLKDVLDQARWACGGEFDVLQQHEQGVRPKSGASWWSAPWHRALAWSTESNRSPEPTQARVQVACRQTPVL